MAAAGDPWNESAVDSLLHLGILLLLSASDHVVAITRSWRIEAGTGFASATLARGALEAGAWAMWLFDPDIDFRIRVARSVSLRLKHLEAAATRLSDLGKSVGDVRRRVASLVALADDAGLTVVHDPRNSDRVRYVEEPLPNVTDLMRDVFGTGGRSMYRLVSAYAHGDHQTLGQRSFDSGKDDGLIEMGKARPIWRFNDFLIDLQVGMSGLAYGFLAFGTYNGWSSIIKGVELIAREAEEVAGAQFWPGEKV